MSELRHTKQSRGAREPARNRSWLLFLVVLAAVLVGVLVTSSCSHLRYYTQAIAGGAEVLIAREPIEQIVAAGKYRSSVLTAEQLDRFETILKIREFASTELGLPDNKSYRTYAAIDRQYVVWNVVAAPEFSVEPVRWCFLFAGCVSYRGYFSQSRAERFGQRLSEEGLDVSVGGVDAYSTLGWFADPILSTFVDDPEPRLAGLIFHELAHQVAYVATDTTFNESFATVVETVGVKRWLAHLGRAVETEEFSNSQRQERDFVELVLLYREKLESLYQSKVAESEKRRAKEALIAELGQQYEQRTGGQGPYSLWFERGLNNADFASVSDYYKMVPALSDELAAADNDLDGFYQRVTTLAALDRSARWAELGVEEAK